MTALLSPRTIARHFGLNPWIDCNPDGPEGSETENDQRDLLARLRRVQIVGARHGRAGYYADGDFSSDADWCYGVGAEIQKLEEILDIDDGAVMDLYIDAHSAFYRDGTINPEDRPGTDTRNQCFTFHFGAYGETAVSVWARHLEDALEIAAAYLAEHAPGLFTDPDYAAAAAEIGVIVPVTNAVVAELYAAGEYDLAERICNRAECDLTYTESGYLASWEWTVEESDTPPGPRAK